MYICKSCRLWLCLIFALAMEFHPNGSIALTAGLDKTLRLFKCDGTRNEKLRSGKLYLYRSRLPTISSYQQTFYFVCSVFSRFANL
jgi:hypothetical protein